MVVVRGVAIELSELFYPCYICNNVNNDSNVIKVK